MSYYTNTGPLSFYRLLTGPGQHCWAVDYAAVPVRVAELRFFPPRPDKAGRWELMPAGRLSTVKGCAQWEYDGRDFCSPPRKIRQLALEAVAGWALGSLGKIRAAALKETSA